MLEIEMILLIIIKKNNNDNTKIYLKFLEVPTYVTIENYLVFFFFLFT